MEAGLGVGGIQQDCAGIEQPENGSKFPKYGKKNLTLHTTMWDLPRPGVEPVSPTLAGGFLTTGPPGKSLDPYIFKVPLLPSFNPLTGLVLHLTHHN